MKVNDFLSAVGKDSMDLQQAWVSDGETPLKWHYPIGLLHDLYNFHSQIWSLTLNEGNFPGKLLRIDYVEIMQDIFMSTCKEAECIRNGSVKRFINLSTSDQSQLWKTVENGFLEQDMNNYLDIQKGLTVGENGTYRSIPLRLYLEDGTIVRKLVQNFGKLWFISRFYWRCIERTRDNFLKVDSSWFRFA
jgi:autophagy-related protein 5